MPHRGGQLRENDMVEHCRQACQAVSFEIPEPGNWSSPLVSWNAVFTQCHVVAEEKPCSTQGPTGIILHLPWGTDTPSAAWSPAQARGHSHQWPVACRLTQWQGVSDPPSQRGHWHQGHQRPLAPKEAGTTTLQRLTLVRLIFCVTREVEPRWLRESLVSPKHWHFINLIANAVTRKGCKCASLPLLKQQDVAAAVWVMVEQAEEERGKILELTRRVRGMQAVRGKGETSTLRPATSWGGGPRLLRKVPSAGKLWEMPSVYGGLSLFAAPWRTSTGDD